MAIPEQFQFSDTLKVFWPPGGALGGNQGFQIQDSALDAECLGADGMIRQILITTASRDLAQQVDRTNVGGQDEIQPRGNRRGVESKGQTRRRASQIRPETFQSGNELLDVVGAATVDDINVLSEAARAVGGRGDSAYEDEVDVSGTQSAQEITKICHVP